MKVSDEEKQEFFKRKNILEHAKSELKREFVGLNDIIDEIIDLIEPWYLFPGGQIRPTIVNLWGMTGVGKTSLIKKMFEHLELSDSLYKFDVGDYASQDNTKLSYSFSENLKNREKHQIGIIFDEFQLGRTIDEAGIELEKSGLRAMWDLLDSGKISILQSSYYGTKIYQLTVKLEECVQNGGVESKEGKIIKNKNYHEKFFKNEEEDEELIEKTSKKNKNKTENEVIENKQEDLFVPSEFYWYIQTIWDSRFITERELKEYLKTMNHTDAIEFLNETMLKAFKPTEFDYSTSCIFVIGNIDEAYRMAKDFEPDADADLFYKHSLKITLPQIKDALQKRFRAEQIARLGNSHVIYPAFSSKVYRELISLELQKSKDKVKERFDIDLHFDKSINSIIYKEGVFPTQGARPVFTTITALIESYVGKIVKDILESGKEIKEINWGFLRNKHQINFIDEDSKSVMKKIYSVRLKVESLRQSVGDELQASVAIHEAGHAVAAIYGASTLPTEIVSRTANMSEGHCVIELPEITTKELLEKYIIILLGGYVAEKMIFGKDNIGVGTGSDFQAATSTALEMAKVYGMTDDVPMLYGHRSTQTNMEFNTESVEAAEKRAKSLISQCEKKCEKILEENKYLMLKMGEYLSINSRMDSKKIIKFIKDYGKEVITIDKDKYHSFKQKIADELAKTPSDSLIKGNLKIDNNTH